MVRPSGAPTPSPPPSADPQSVCATAVCRSRQTRYWEALTSVPSSTWITVPELQTAVSSSASGELGSPSTRWLIVPCSPRCWVAVPMAYQSMSLATAVGSDSWSNGSLTTSPTRNTRTASAATNANAPTPTSTSPTTRVRTGVLPSPATAPTASRPGEGYSPVATFPTAVGTEGYRPPLGQWGGPVTRRTSASVRRRTGRVVRHSGPGDTAPYRIRISCGGAPGRGSSRPPHAAPAPAPPTAPTTGGNAGRPARAWCPDSAGPSAGPPPPTPGAASRGSGSWARGRAGGGTGAGRGARRGSATARSRDRRAVTTTG